jgi:hypothetical protein
MLWDWLRERLTNMPQSWITQIAHFAVMYGIAMTFPAHPYWLAAGIVGYAAWKEFYFDIRYELPAVSGGIRGGIVDFCFLSAGGLLGAWMAGGCR